MVAVGDDIVASASFKTILIAFLGIVIVRFQKYSVRYPEVAILKYSVVDNTLRQNLLLF